MSGTSIIAQIFVPLKHIFATLKTRLGRDLPISVNDRVISPIREDFVSAKLRICEVSRK